MSLDQHQAFLTATKVPMRLSIAHGEKPIIVALWFTYEAGKLWCACHQNSYLVRQLRSLIGDTDAAHPCAFDISTNEIPYRGVAGSGTVSLHADLGADKLRGLTTRYLEQADSPFAQWLLSRADDEVALCITPDTVRHWDFTERMSD